MKHIDINSIRRKLWIILCAIAAIGAAAQNLSKEITVDRVIASEQKPVDRPNLMPSLLLPQQGEANMRPAEYLEQGNISTMLSQLAPASWHDSVARTPYRGYAAVGYFPVVNIGANAGYRIIDKRNLSLSAWAQYNGARFSNDDLKLGSDYVNGAIEGFWHANSNSALSLKANYQYANILRPRLASDEGYWRATNSLDTRMQWRSQVGNWFYSAAAEVSLFKFGMPNADVAFTDHSGNALQPVSQRGCSIEGEAGYLLRGNPIKVAADALFLNSNGIKSGTLGEIHIRPSYIAHVKAFTFGLGANVSLGTHGDSSASIAPDVTIAFAPKKSAFAAWIKVSGGEYLNPVAGIFADNPYASPYLTYGRYRLPIAIDAAINIGAFGGFSASLFGSWAKADDYLLPYSPLAGNGIPQWYSPYGGTAYKGQDISSWMAGIKLSYSWRTLIKAEAKFATAGSDNSIHSWYRWADSAKYTADASVTVSPIAALDINVDYHLRACRRVEGATIANLGNISDLSFGASYALTDAITTFARIENILNRTPLHIAMLPMQGIHGLIGISVKF